MPPERKDDETGSRDDTGFSLGDPVEDSDEYEIDEYDSDEYETVEVDSDEYDSDEYETVEVDSDEYDSDEYETVEDSDEYETVEDSDEYETVEDSDEYSGSELYETVEDQFSWDSGPEPEPVHEDEGLSIGDLVNGPDDDGSSLEADPGELASEGGFVEPRSRWEHVMLLLAAISAVSVALYFVVDTNSWDPYHCETDEGCRGIKSCFDSQCVSPEMWQQTHDSIAIESGSERILLGTAQASLEAAPFGTTGETACEGWVGGPYHEFILSRPESDRNLTVCLTTDTDSTLVVRNGEQSWCASGADPCLSYEWVSGAYELLVGGLQQNESSSYTVSFSDEAIVQEIDDDVEEVVESEPEED